MRIRWRGMELPSRVVRDEAVSTDRYGRFTIEPFEQGFGTTIGNSLRRVLLSSLEGAAIATVKIQGVSHEFTNIDGVLEDVTDILLNIKGIVLKIDGDGHRTLTVRRDTVGDVKAGDLQCDPSVTVANPSWHLATLTSNVPFQIELSAGIGRGFATAGDNRGAEQELGVIPIDSIFSPVVRVRYRVEAMRVGQRTNYDRLILEIWTKGTVMPEEALVESALILRKYLNPIIMCHELGDDVVSSLRPILDAASHRDSGREELLDKSVSILNLSVRASNCLEAAKICTLRELVKRTEADLLRVRSFGKTSLHEVHRKLSEVGLSLTGGSSGLSEEGMTEDDDGAEDDMGGSNPSTGSSAGPLEVFTMGE